MARRGIGKTVEEGLAILGLTPEQIGLQAQQFAAKPKTNRLPPKKKDLADLFCKLWDQLGPKIPYTREYRFSPPRRWRFDVCWPEYKVAVEMEGGIWTRGGHTRGMVYRKNCQKYNAAAKLGWRLLRYVINDLEQSPVQTIEEVAKLLQSDHEHGGTSMEG